MYFTTNLHHRKSVLTTLLIALICTGGLFAQGTLLPDGFGQNDLSQVQLIQLSELDNAELQATELAARRPGVAPNFALPRDVDIRPETHGTWETLTDGRSLWRLRIASPKAYSLNLGFTEYYMPEGATLMLANKAGDYVIGPFTEGDNEEHLQLWTPIVRGDEIVIEVILPAVMTEELKLHLSKVNHDYMDFGKFGGDGIAESGSCNVDVVCPEGDGYRDIIRSVGVISTGGGTFCTGFLVNNTANDGTPYFMTADHCGVGSGNASSLVVYWNYENSWCRTPGSGASGGSGDGSLSTYNTGSIFRSDGSFSDFTLVELDDPINVNANAYLAGWNRAFSGTPSAVAVHHPQTDEKRISFEDDPTNVTSYLGNSSPGNGSHIKVTQWDLGTTEPGSSGSPLYDENKRVVGQLHGGYASCSSLTADWYGIFSASWDHYAGSDARLQPWLDPIGTNPVVWDGMEASGGVSCSTGSAPTGLDATVGATNVDLSWTAIPGSVGCQIQGRPLGAGGWAKKNILGSEVTSASVDLGILLSSTTYEWTVTCACDISPLNLTPTSAADQFTTPALREGVKSNVMVDLYPNPAADHIIVSYEASADGNLDLRITDMTGRTVSQLQMSVLEGPQQLSISVNDLPNGFYMLETNSAGSRDIMQFAVSH